MVAPQGMKPRSSASEPERRGRQALPHFVRGDQAAETAPPAPLPARRRLLPSPAFAPSPGPLPSPSPGRAARVLRTCAPPPIRRADTFWRWRQALTLKRSSSVFAEQWVETGNRQAKGVTAIRRAAFHAACCALLAAGITWLVLPL